MKEELQSAKEIKILLFAFIFIGFMSLFTKYVEYFAIEDMKNTTVSIFKHPLQVSNSSLSIQRDVYRIHRDMKDVVLSSSQKDIKILSQNIKLHEQEVYKNFKIIEQYILGQEGLALEKEAKDLFSAWKPIRDEVISLMSANKIKQAVAITKGKGAKHVLKLENATLKLYNYARNKAVGFKNKSQESFEDLIFIQIINSFSFLIIFIFIGYYTINRIRNYIYKIHQQNRYRFALETISDGVWDWDFTTNDIYFSPTLKALWGYKEDELEGKHQEWYSQVHPDDKEKILSDVKSCIDSKNGMYKNIHRMKHKDGHWIWIEAKGMVLFDSDGNALRMIGSDTDITETKEIQIALQKEKERYDIAEKLGKVGSWEQGANNEELSWSKEIYDIFEIDILDEMSFDDFINRVHPDDKEALVNAFKKSLENKTAYYFAHRLLFDDARVKYIIERARHFYDEDGNHIRTVGTVQDITDKQDALELAQQKQRELETVFNEAPTPMALHNEDGDILMINKVWEELTGYKHSEIDTIFKWADKTTSKKSKIRTDYIKNLFDITHRISEGEFEVITKDGKTLYWLFFSAPLGVIDGKKVLISNAMDITELKQKDEMLIAQSRMAAMGEMISMIAHQWRQPIASIAMDANNMLADIALDEFCQDLATEYSHGILKQTNHLSKTIDDFRNFFKSDKTLKSVKLKDIIDETYSIVKDSLNKHNVKFVSSSESVLEVNAYPRELMQVFVNILTNAKDSLVSSKTPDATIKVNIYDEKDFIVTQICDNGSGIDEEILPKIFDPYFTTKDEKTGTGLGLYMSKMIIEKHLKGIIEVQNSSLGVCFLIKLPIG